MSPHRLCLGLIAALLAGCAPRPAPLRIMSYNIHHGIGMDRRLDLARTIEALRRARPDLVALQEVDRGTRRSHRVDQLQALADGTGLEPIFGKTIDFDGGEYGIAILSRLSVTHQRIHPLPNTPPHEKRVLMEVGVQLAGREIIFYNTDLDDNRDDGERLGSIELFERSARDHPRAAVILAGDLFVTADHALMRRLLTTLRDSVEAGREPDPPTVPAADPVKRIDYILYRPDPFLRCRGFEVVADSMTAQHRPVLADFAVKPF